MSNFGLGVVLLLASSSVLAQTTTCEELAGGLIQCSAGRQAPSPDYAQQARAATERAQQQFDLAQAQWQQQQYQQQQLDLQKRQVELLEEQQLAQRTQLIVGQQSEPSSKMLTPEMLTQELNCGSPNYCDTTILHKPADVVTGENWLNAINRPTTTKVHTFAMILAGEVFFWWEGKSHCPPVGITLNQAISLAELYLQRRPQMQHYPAPSLLAAAFMTEWPCQESKQRAQK